MTDIDVSNDWELRYIQEHAKEIADLVAASSGDDLDLAGRNIKSLEAAFFEQPQSILSTKKSIDLSYNSLRSLPDEFSQLFSLESLNISYNRFEGNLPRQLSTLSSLTCLRMNMNAVTSLDVLTTLGELRILQMGACSVSKLPEDFGHSVPQLMELTITQNGLECLSQLSGTSKLRRLLCYMNNIKTIPESCCRSWGLLKELHLTSNQLTALPDEISCMEALEVLDLSSNFLKEIPKSIVGCTNLRKLAIAKNQLVEFPPIHKNMTSLKEIDLSFNQINHIFPPDTPQQEQTVEWPRLEEFNVVRNKIRSLPASILRLADPRYGCLIRLLLEHNRLVTLPSIEDPSVLNRLETFTFKMNRFIDLPPVLETLNRSLIASFKETLPDEVIPGLFIGSLSSARNFWALHALGITHILNASFHSSDTKIPSVFTYKCLNLQDSQYQPLLQLLPDIVDHIHGIISRGEKCLVHCQAGISRSAALVIAYLMSQRQMSFTDAIDHLRASRPVVSPNKHFLAELQRFSASLGRESADLEIATETAPLNTAAPIIVDGDSPNSDN